MELQYIPAERKDALLLVRIYNDSFYDDYVKYGECPAYGRSTEAMEISIDRYPKTLIYCDGIPVGALSADVRGDGEYYLGCLCVIPRYQGKGIGTGAVKYMLEKYSDWRKITLITPVDKVENISFYTQKCGFRIDGEEMDGGVRVCRLVKERNL